MNIETRRAGEKDYPPDPHAEQAYAYRDNFRVMRISDGMKVKQA